MKEPRLSISAVERDVGLSKDVLRVWERRYGFPVPERDANGERAYPVAQVLRLRLIKRLMDQGHRPGRLLAAPTDELEALAGTPPAAAAERLSQVPDPLAELVDLIVRHDATGFLQAMQQQLAREGLRRFVLDTVAPMTGQIGLAWERGRLQVFEEHLFTELTTRVLRQGLATLPAGGAPRVLLCTLPGEPHGMGLLMVEAVLALEGAHCISLGTQMPLLEIVDAAAAHRADVVGLSFSVAFPPRQMPPLLASLRKALSPATELWVGGAGARKLTAGEGVILAASLDDATATLQRWRERAGTRTAESRSD